MRSRVDPDSLAPASGKPEAGVFHNRKCKESKKYVADADKFCYNTTKRRACRFDCQKRKFWNIPPEEEQTGLLLWFQILQKHYLKLFGANAIAVLSLLPCAYFIYLLIQTGDVVFWVVGLALFVLASPCQTGLHSVCVRLVHRMPVWVKDEFINAWKQEWKPSMLLGLILGVLWSVLAYGAYMVIKVDGGMSVGYLLMMLLAAYFLTGLTLFGYQQIAMLDLPFGTQLKNAALLILPGNCAPSLPSRCGSECFWFP